MAIFAYVWKDTPNPQDIGSTNSEPVVTADLVTGTPTANTIATATYATIAAKAAGRRGLLLRSLGYAGRSDFGSFKAGLTLPSFLVNGYKSEAWAHWMTDFWQSWKAQGSVRPDDIILDTEGDAGLGDMTVSPATSAAIEAAAASGSPLRRFLPADFHGLSAAQIAAQYPNATLTGVFDRFTREIMAEALYRVAGITYTAVMGTACPPITNFGMGIARGTAYSDYNRPTLPERTSLDGNSCPVCFIQTPGSLPVPKYAGLTKEIRWNDFISTLNWARSQANVTRAWVARWKFNGNSAPLATNIGGFREMVRHLAALGVTKLIQFASGLQVSEIAQHEEVFASATPAPSQPANGYATIPYDSDSVTTNGYTTTYSAGDWA